MKEGGQWHTEEQEHSGACQEGRGWLKLGNGVYPGFLPSSTGGACEGEKREKDPGILSASAGRPGQQAGRLQGRGEGAGWLHLMLVALPAGRCGGDKLDTGATAPEAPAATGTEAGATQACAQVVPSAGGEGVAAAPTETQASTSGATAAAIAAV